MASEDPIIEKIRKLLRQAQSGRGSTTAEAETALAMAQKLMTKHGIEQVTLREDEDAPRKLDIKEVWHKTGRQRYETDQYIARILERCYMVRVLWASDIQLIASKKHLRGAYDDDWNPLYNEDGSRKMVGKEIVKERLIYVLVGDKLDVDVAMMVIETLHPMMRRQLNAYLRETGQVWSAVVCHSFFEGLRNSFCEANAKGAKQASLEAGEEATSKYQLAVVDKDAAVAEFIKSNITTVRSRHRSGPLSGGFDNGAYKKGESVGKTLNPAAKRLE